MAETFDELLKRLSEVKRLPAPEKPYRTQQAAVGSDLRDTARSAFAGTPRLADAIRDIQQGGSAATGPKGLLASALNSAPAKALFGGLTVIDTPRRAVISTIKEVGDALDNDPNTKFSGSDWRSQVADPTFGFGRVAPGKGWGGRLVGFIGDVALDPMTYLTFGASVPLKAGPAAQRLLAQGATKTLFRKSVSISGREGRFALARAAKQMGASDDIVRNVAARGKSALTPELASKLGVRRNGLYMFGSRVRIKGTGRIGDYLERGLIGSRLGLTNTKVGKKLQYLYTPRGSGTMGDLSTWRADVASGRLAPERVKMIVSALSGAEDARTLGAVARADELRRVAGLFDNDVEMQQFAADLHRFIEKPESSVLSVGQQAARKKVEDYLDDVATRIEQMMGEIEPGWKFNRVQRYVPHILTERARNAIDARADTPWAQFLEKYMSVDVLDMKGNLQQRHIVSGMENFLGSGRRLEDGSIEGINKMFREVTGENFDLFETDMRKILGGYANTVKSSAEITGLMKNLKDDDFVRVLKETGHVDEDFQKILKSRIDDKWDTVAKNTEKLNELQKKAREVLQNTAGSKGSVAKRLLAKEKGLLGEVEELTDDIGKATLVADQLVPLLEQMDTVTAAQLAAAEELNLMMVGGNAATSLVKEQILSFQNTVDVLKKQLDSARFDKWQTRVAANVAEDALQTLDSDLQDLGKKLVSNQKMLDALQRYGDSLGPEIERIFRAFRSDSFADDTATVSFGGRMSSSDVGEFIETDQEFNRVIDAVSNPFDTNYLAGPGGEAAGTKGIADAWVQQVVSTEGTPEYELLQSIPDFGARGGKAERVSMGSVRENARAITLQEAREIVIRASLLGDNLEDAADAFYFLTLRELRASELLVVDEAARANARSAFAQELLNGSSERAKSWRTARAQVQRLSKVKQQYDVLASQKTQLGTTTVGGQKIYLSEEGRELIPNLQKQLAELETTPDDPLLQGAYTDALKTLDSLISGSGDAYITVSKASQGLTRFFDLASVKGTLVEGAGLDAAARNRTAVYELVGSFIDENMNINVQSVIDAKNALQAFVREYSVNPAKIQMKRAELAEAMNNPLVAQAQYVSQQFALAERTVAATTREVGDVLTNYSIYHNARVAVDYVHRLLPQGVEISDALLRFAFAGSAKQHEKYVLSMEQARSWVAGHWAKIESERVGVAASEQAGWLKQRLTSKVILDENNKEKLVPLSVDELIKLSQVMGDLTLVARKVPRDIQAWRPNQPQWSSHVKKILDLVDAGWDNSMTQQVSDAVKAETRGPSRVGYEQGTGVRAGSRKTSQELGGLSDKTSREMQGAFKIQSEVNNTISNKKKLSPETLIELIEKKRDAGELSSEVASKLIEDTKVLGDSLKAEFKAYKAKIKEETGYSVSELNSVVKALKNSPADTMGMANLWDAATKTRGDGGTRSLRAIDDFFAYLRGGQDVLVSRGGKGSAGGVPETFQVDLADELFGDEVTAGAVAATQRDYRVGGQGSRGTRVVEITDEISKAGKKDADATLKRIYADARKVRKSGIERMAYIAAQLGLDEEDDIVRIIQRAVEADDRMRVLKLRIKGVDAKTKDQLDELVEEHKLVVRRIQKDFDEAVRSTVTGVTRGSMSPDIVKHVSYGDSHLGKMRNALARKISGLQELVFSPEAGLANVDSLRFGVDDLDNGRLSLYRVRYLRGLAEDYRQSIEAYEKAVKAAEKVRPGSKAGKNVVEDFATFREVYGDERKFGQLVRWIEETQNAIDNGYELPVKPFGLKIPKRVEKNLRAIKKAKEKITDVMQSPEFNAAREAEDFYEFLRELSDLNIDPKYFPEISQVRYKYDAVAERALRNQLSVLAGGMSPDSVGRIPQMSVYKMESVNFDGKLMEAFMNASDDIRDLSVVVRTENGYDEIVDNPRAVIDYVRASRKQKFSYSVTETTDSRGRRQITYTDLNGPAGSRDNYVYYVDDYDSREFAPGTDFEIGAARTIRGVGGAQNPPALVGSQTVLDAPIYAWYGAQGILPSASPSNVLRHYSALAAGQPTSVLRYSDVGADGVARKLVVGGNAEAKSKTAVDANDFFHMVDPSDTHVVYDIPSKGHRIIERFDRSGLPLGQTQALLPQEIFFGITNDTIAAAFAREQVAGSRRTTTLFNKLKDLSNRKTELRNSIDEAQYNMRLRQKLLVELDDVETELASVRKELNDGLPEARNAARAAAYNLFERFKQQSVAGFILGRTFDTPDDASAFALEAFKKYAKQLREKKIVHTFESGEVGELYPFNPDLGVADRRKANLSKNWNESPDKKIISQHDALNKAINAASKDLDVVKAGGDAADLAARYADVLEQLRVAERKLALDKSNVATEFYRTVDDSTLNALTKNRDSASEALNVARATQKSAQDAVRAAGQEFIPTAQLRSAESRLERLVAGGASQQEIMNLTSQVAVLRQNINAALDRRTQLVAQAEEALRKANADVLTQEASLKEANKQLREAGRQADEGRRNALAMLERDSLDPNKGPMTPDKFDEFVASEIEKIKEGRVSDFAVSVSTESVDRVVAEGAELSARKEALLSLHPGLQSRYEAARALMDQAEKRYKDLQDQFEKASNTLRNIEAAESRGGALAFGGKNYPAEYATAKAQQIEARKRVTVAQKRLDELTSQVVKVTAEVNAARSAGAELNTLTLKKDEAVGRLSLLRGALDTLRKETPEGYPSWVKGVLAKDWDAEFEDVSNELNLVFRSLASLPDDMQGKDIDRMWAVWTKVLEARAAVLLSKDDWEYAVQLERMGAAGILNSDNLIWKNLPDDGATVLSDTMSTVLREEPAAGFVKLEGKGSARGFTGLQMRPEVSEILTNMARIRDPQFVRSMRRWLTPYTRFFKSWALATPGFHVRNSVTNGFGMIAAGGSPVHLYEAMVEYNKMHRFLRQGKTIQEYLDTIADGQRKKLLSDSYNAMAGSGVGQAEEALIDNAGVLSNNFVTRGSRRAGAWVEAHSRFMLAYDGLKQGLDVPASTARVRKFLFDYEDISKLDAYMRQIIPFWTWTSRNIPLTVTNIYMNPRPYQIYQSFKRNVQDNEKTEALPLYMREAGAFAVAGTGLAATPELGFNRLQADISMLSDPTRIAANVNPLLRVPVETMLANKSFFRNREFNKTPIEAEGPVGTLASLLGAPIGMGQSVGDKRFVDEKLMYGITNTLPLLNQVERFLPSQEYYKQRGTTNPALGFFGAPFREVTDQMLTSEQRRRINELKKLLESQPKVKP